MALKGTISLVIEGKYADKLYGIIGRGFKEFTPDDGEYSLMKILIRELGEKLLPTTQALIIREDSVKMLDAQTLSVDVHWRNGGLGILLYLFANCPDIRLYFYYALEYNERIVTNDKGHKYFKGEEIPEGISEEDRLRWYPDPEYCTDEEIKEAVQNALDEEANGGARSGLEPALQPDMAPSPQARTNYDDNDLPF